MIIDTHAHYDDPCYDKDRDELLERINASGVIALINSAAAPDSIEPVLELTRKHDYIYASMGIHPHYAADMTEDILLAVKEAVLKDRAEKTGKIVAIGETGLDYHYEDTDKNAQALWFERQIGLAKELKLPVVIHSRDAAADTLEILKRTDAGENGGDMHCYSYSKETAKQLLDLNFSFGIGGVLTFKNAKKLKEVVEYIPLESILLETDAPYLTPEPDRGKRNSSEYLPRVVKEIAAIKDISEDKVLAVTEENARKLFGIRI